MKSPKLESQIRGVQQEDRKMTSKAVKKESLEERLERIRKKNEEIEAKHKAVERDRMIAKMQNALVDMKPSADDWPREHKYDRLDITYDVPESQLEAEKGMWHLRGGWKFWPNFFPYLAAKLEIQQRRAQKAARFTDIPPDPNSFLADEERDGVRRDAANANAAVATDKVKPANRGRQITGRKKFPLKSTSQEFNEASLPAPNPNWRKSTSDADAEMQKNFENLTVSVSQDGDFKSVKLTQSQIIGSGRVGPRQITKTQFQPMQPVPQFVTPMPFDKNAMQRKSERRRQQPNFNKELPKRSNSFKATTGLTPPATGLGNKPFSVQDRLKRVVQTEPSANNKNMILHIISSNEIIAAEDRNHRAPNA